MDNVEARLIRCFQVVFPDLDEAVIRQASMDTVAEWDSVAMVTLINVIEEEFATQIALEEVEHAVSFAQLAAYLQEKN